MTIEFDFGVITLLEIKENVDGNPARFAQCRVTADEDAQLVELMRCSGDDSAPPLNTTVFIIDFGGRRIGFPLNDGIEPEALSEEKISYSSSGESKAATISQRTDGTIEINGAADFAVRFNQLETIIAAQVQNVVNANLTAIQGEISSLGGSYTPTLLNIDLTGARVDSVKLPD